MSDVGGSPIGIERDFVGKFRETNVVLQMPGQKIVECKPMSTLFDDGKGFGHLRRYRQYGVAPNTLRLRLAC